MHITIIGNGNMAKGIGSRVLAGGHHLTVLGRDVLKAESLAAELNKIIRPKIPAEGAFLQVSAVKGEAVVLALGYSAVEEVMKIILPALNGKILIDITNPLNNAYDGLSIPGNSSAAEEIEKLTGNKIPVVKAFNTVFSSSLLEGSINNLPLDIFIAGDDTKAKSTVEKLIKDGGMRTLDVGPLKFSRQLEQFALFSIMIQQPLGFGFRSAWKLLTPNN